MCPPDKSPYLDGFQAAASTPEHLDSALGAPVCLCPGFPIARPGQGFFFSSRCKASVPCGKVEMKPNEIRSKSIKVEQGKKGAASTLHTFSEGGSEPNHTYPGLSEAIMKSDFFSVPAFIWKKTESISVNCHSRSREVAPRAKFKKAAAEMVLPAFVIRDGPDWRLVSYEADILSRVNWQDANLNPLYKLELNPEEKRDVEVVAGLSDQLKGFARHTSEEINSFRLCGRGRFVLRWSMEMNGKNGSTNCSRNRSRQFLIPIEFNIRKVT